MIEMIAPVIRHQLGYLTYLRDTIVRRVPRMMLRLPMTMMHRLPKYWPRIR